MRTKGAGHDETKRRILKTARGLVLKHGHANLSLREIARLAGFGPASLYEYFSGKEAIVATLAREASASLKTALDRSAKAATDRSVLIDLGMAYVDWAKKHSEDFLLLFGRLPSKRKALTESSTLESPYQVVLEAVQRAAKAKVVTISTPADVEHIAYGIWATAHGMAMLQLTHLAGFKADFVAADRASFQALIEGWK
jgi:AcrR family transcriptional regulator